MNTFVSFTQHLFTKGVSYQFLRKLSTFSLRSRLPLSGSVAFGAVLLLSFCLSSGLGCQSRIERQIYNLQDQYASRRMLAVEALSKIDDERTIEPLIAALKDKDPDVVWRAAAALGDKGNNRAIEPLITTLKHNDLAVQHFVAAALVKIGEPAVKPLINALKNKNPVSFRIKVINVLGKIGDNRAVGPLIAALKDTSSDAIRAGAAIALGKIGDKRAVEPLILALKDMYSILQDEAAAALARIGEPAVEPLITRLKDKSDVVRLIVIRLLGKIIALDSLKWKHVIPSNRIHYLYAKGQKNELLNEWELTNKILLNDMQSGIQKLIQNAVYAYIDLKGNDIIPELIKMLESDGNIFMAQVYLDSRNQNLMNAAIEWADRHKFNLISESDSDKGVEGRRDNRTSQ